MHWQHIGWLQKWNRAHHFQQQLHFYGAASTAGSLGTSLMTGHEAGTAASPHKLPIHTWIAIHVAADSLGAAAEIKTAVVRTTRHCGTLRNAAQHGKNPVAFAPHPKVCRQVGTWCTFNV
jgi:hypothetical protein